MSLLGRSLNRLEDERFLRGRGHYVDDIAVPQALVGLVVRSPHAHARLPRIDGARAAALPGVAAILTGADLLADGIGPLPCAAASIPMTKAPIVPPYRALAHDVVRYVGEPVAFVVATTDEAARNAAEALRIDYEPIVPVMAVDEAVSPGAPTVWPEAPGNIAFQFDRGSPDAIEAAMRQAAHVVSCDIVNNRVVAAPMETRGALGTFDPQTGRLHLTASASGAPTIRDLLADHVFRIPRDRLRVTIPDVGGGFGMKNMLYPELVLVLWAAHRLRRAVKWVGDRTEDFLGSVHGRDSRVSARLALDAQGRFLALDAKILANMGAVLSTVAPIVPTSAWASAMGGVYDIPLIGMQTLGVFTNTTPVDAYRGAGKPEANYLIERLIDLAAAWFGFDPVRLRRKNIVRRFPHRSAMGLALEAGQFAHGIDHAVAAAEGFAARRKLSRRQGKLRGLGIACFLETARGTPNEVAEVGFDDDGRIALKVGTHSNGQSHETTYAQIAADQLGLPIERFRYVQGETDALEVGAGHGGARSMHQGGTALLLAAEGMIAQARRLAAQLLQASFESVSYDAGLLRVAGTGQDISLDEVARASRNPATSVEGVAPGLTQRATHVCDAYTFPNGCHVAEVEIDPDTGAVTLERYQIFDDYGRLLDPRLTLGQVQGGVAQGIGQALLEQIVFDESGQMLSGSLMDYALPRAADLPPLTGELTTDYPSQANRLGVKGSGQAGAIGSPATVMNAVMNALAEVGVHELDMPATPYHVWRAIRVARQTQT